MSNWFSNFLPFDVPLQYQGMSFACVETFYQAMKTEKTDLETRRRISQMTAVESKRAGRKVKLRADWPEVKERVMEFALRHKFAPGTSWHRRLMDTGYEPITEWNTWHDQEWGSCVCSRCCRTSGKNKLGELLMKLRAEYETLKASQS